jgi:hypothetical protein
VHFVDTEDENKASLREHEATEEKFFEQFAAIEESLALLQVHIRDMSENVRLFSSLAMHIRRSVCLAAPAQDQRKPTATCVPRDPKPGIPIAARSGPAASAPEAAAVSALPLDRVRVELQSAAAMAQPAD